MLKCKEMKVKLFSEPKSWLLKLFIILLVPLFLVQPAYADSTVNIFQHETLSTYNSLLRAMSFCQQNAVTLDGYTNGTVNLSLPAATDPSNPVGNVVGVTLGNNRSQLRNALNLKLYFDGGRIYSNYLEANFSKDQDFGKSGDGNFLCKDLGKDGKYSWDQLLSYIQSYDTSTIKPLVCGTNGTDGLVKFSAGYDLNPKNGSLPEGFPDVEELNNDGTPKTQESCFKLYDALFNAVTKDYVFPTQNGKPLKAKFEINRKSFLDNNIITNNIGLGFLGGNVNLSDLILLVNNTDKYLAITQSYKCGASRETETDYNNAIKSGAANHYKFYISGLYQFWNVSLNDDVVVGFKTTRQTESCHKIAEELDANSDNVMDRAKEVAIEQCYQSYTDGLDTIRKHREEWGNVKSLAEFVLNSANTAISGGTPQNIEKSTGEILNLFNVSLGNEQTQFTMPYQLINKATFIWTKIGVKVGASAAPWSTSYSDPYADYTLTNDDIAELQYYISEYNTFLTQVDEKIASAEALDPGENAHLKEDGTINLSVENYYSFNSNATDLNCAISDLLKTITDEIGTLAGGTIDYTTFAEQQALNNAASSGSSGVSSTTQCLNVAGSFGWVLCPIMDFLSNTVKWFYEKVIEPQLIMDPTLVDAESGTRSAWESIRDIANIIFVLFFLFVIFSQLTGYGIDNYGIKKALPKIIIGAILVNLSFLICQAAVDLSNIVGSGIKNLIESIEVSVPESFVQANGLDGSLIGKGGVAVALIGGLVAGGFWVAHVGVGAAAAAILFPILGAVLSIFVSYLLLVFFLSLRKAMVIVLVAASPIAFVCYMLPNTKYIFDKWKKIFTAMLILYPTCSLLMSGGKFAGKVILRSGGGTDLVLVLIAAIVEIGPLFLIPTVARSAFHGLGIVGARLTGMASRFPGNARRRVNNSQAAKRMQEKSALARGNNILKRYNESLDKNKKNRNLNLIDRYRLRNTRGNREQIMEAGKAQIAADARNKEFDMWSSHGQAIISTKLAQNEARFNAEKTQMYADQFSRLDVQGLEDALRNAINGGTADMTEQFTAAFNALAKAGQLDKARNVIDANSDAFSNALGDSHFRIQAMQTLGASGNFIMQEYAKHLGTHNTPENPALSFNEWATGAHTEGGLSSSIRDKGLDKMDKDDFKFLAAHPSALAGASAQELARVASNVRDTATANEVANAIRALIASNPARSDEVSKTIISATSGTQAIQMHDNIRVAISGGDDSKWSEKIAAAIRDNPQLSTGLSDSESARYLHPSTPEPDQSSPEPTA